MIYLFNKKMQGKEPDKKLPFHVFPSACLSEPVQIRIETFFKYQHQYRSRIADRINHCDEETHISPNPETGYKTVEENCLKTKIGKVEAKALNKQPHQRRKLQAIVIESDETESYRTCNDQRQQGRKNFDMTFH